MLKKLLVFVFCIGLVGNVWAEKDEGNTDIAKINYNQIRTTLIDYALSKEENKALKQEYEAQMKKQATVTKEMIRQYAPSPETGKIEVDVNEMFGGKDYKGIMEIQNTVDALSRTELANIIKGIFGDKYQVVIEERKYSDNLIYSDIVIPDITLDIQRYLLNLKIKEGSKE